MGTFTVANFRTSISIQHTSPRTSDCHSPVMTPQSASPRFTDSFRLSYRQATSHSLGVRTVPSKEQRPAGRRYAPHDPVHEVYRCETTIWYERRLCIMKKDKKYAEGGIFEEVLLVQRYPRCSSRGVGSTALDRCRLTERSALAPSMHHISL